MNNLSALNTLGTQLVSSGLDVVRAAHKVDQAGLCSHHFLQGQVVHVKPAGDLCAFGNHGIRVDRNDLKIGQRKRGRGYFEQAVVRAVFFVFASGAWGDAEGVFAPLNASFERRGHHHEVINLSFHGRGQKVCASITDALRVACDNLGE